MPTVYVNNSGQTGGVSSSVASSSNASGYYFYGNLYNQDGTNLAYDHTNGVVYYMGQGNDGMLVDGSALQTAGNTLYIDGGGGSDTLSANLSVVTTAFTMTDSALTTGTANFQNFEIYSLTLGSAGDTVTLNGAAGDSINLAGGNDVVAVTNSRGTSYFQGGDGFNRLTVNNSSQSAGVSSSIASSNGYFYGNLYNLDGGNLAYDKFHRLSYTMGSGADSLTFDGTSLATANSAVTVNAGGGIDSLSANLSGMTANLTMTNSSVAGGNVTLNNFEYYSLTFGSGNDTVTRTGGKADNINLGAGNDSVTVTNSRFTSYYNGQDGFNTLSVDNSAQATGISSSIAAANGYFYGNLYNDDGGNLAYDKFYVVDYKMGSGADSLTLDGTSLATAGNSVTVDAGAGSDSLGANLSSMTADLTLTDHSLTGGNVSLTNFDVYGVTLGSGNNTVILNQAIGDTVIMGSGNDTVTVTDSRSTSSFQFNGGFNSLTLDNSMQATGVSSSIASANGYFYGNLYNTDGGNLAYDKVHSLTYKMGSGNDSLTIDGASLAVAANYVSVDAGAGRDILSANLSVMTADLAIDAASISGGNVILTGFDVYHLTTGSGNDTAKLTGRAGDDFVFGLGNDRMELTNNNGNTSVNFGDGFDTLVLNNGIQSAGVSSTIASASGHFYGNLYNSSGGNLAYDNVEAISYVMSKGDDNLSLSAAAMLGTANTLTVNAGAGYDGLGANLSVLTTRIVMTDASIVTGRLSLTNFDVYSIDFGSGNDSATLLHGDGDNLRMREGDDTVVVTDVRTNNTFDGGDGMDSLTINNGAQTVGVSSTIASASGHFYGNLYNSSGGNTAYDHFERVVYTMGSGNDSLTFDGASLATARSLVKVDAGDGVDTLSANLSSATAAILITATSLRGTNFRLDHFDTFNVTLSNYNDFVYQNDGATGDNYVLAGGNDSITLINALGNSSINGGDGVDQIKVVNGTETVGVTSTIASSGDHFYGNLYNDTGGNVAFDNAEIMFYAMGKGNDTLNVNASALNTVGNVLYLDGGQGVDTLNIDLSALGPLTMFYSNGTWAFGANRLVHFETLNFNFGGNALTLGLDDANNSFSSGSGNDVINGKGGNDLIRGNAGHDLISGGTGADNMYGGSGDDTYIVDDTGDRAWEQTTFGVDDGGTDLVKSSVSFTLSGFIENLTLFDTPAIDGTGNTLNNTISGNNANNVLKGLAGNDTLLGNGGNDTLVGGAGDDLLTGGAGNDTFMFDKFGTANGVDHITDFSATLDVLAFKASDYGYAAGHVLTAAEYRTGAAVGSNGQFLYDTTTHTLSWDADGTGATAAVAIAVFDNSAKPLAGNFLFT